MRYKDSLNKEDYNVISIFEITDNTYVCNTCGEILPKSDFYEGFIKNKDIHVSMCKECHKFWRKCHHLKDPNYARKRDKEWQKQNREKLNSHRVNRRKKDYLFNIKERLISKLSAALKYKNWKKNDSITKSVGCDPEFLCKYIESKFKPGMDWNNRHLWHIDHRIPLSSAKTVEELLKLNHYTNLQPLWAEDNLKKSNKL